jgi:transcriptional regulator with XRE-family HTH domain
MPTMTRLAGQGKALRIARTIDGRSRDSLADAAGIGRLRLFQIETDRVRPTADELHRLWSALVIEPQSMNDGTAPRATSVSPFRPAD